LSDPAIRPELFFLGSHGIFVLYDLPRFPRALHKTVQIQTSLKSFINIGLKEIQKEILRI